MAIATSRDPAAAEETWRPMTGNGHESWRESAACRHVDPELFFPIGSTGTAAAETRRAKAICGRCPVQQTCLTYALVTGQVYGIWGGHSEAERRVLHWQWRQSRTADRARPESQRR